MKKILLIFLIIYTSESYSQERFYSESKKDTIQKILEVINRTKVLPACCSYNEIDSTKQCLRFAFLISMTDIKDLKKIFKTNEGISRAFAYNALKYNNYMHIKRFEKLIRCDKMIIIVSIQGILVRSTMSQSIIHVYGQLNKSYIQSYVDRLNSDNNYRLEVYKDIIR